MCAAPNQKKVISGAVLMTTHRVVATRLLTRIDKWVETVLTLCSLEYSSYAVD
jgi:hypothetical protein